MNRKQRQLALLQRNYDKRRHMRLDLAYLLPNMTRQHLPNLASPFPKLFGAKSWSAPDRRYSASLGSDDYPSLNWFLCSVDSSVELAQAMALYRLDKH